MAAVYSYSDIPGGVADYGSCNGYYQQTIWRRDEIQGYVDSLDDLLAKITLSLSAVANVGTELTNAIASFDEGAYEDNVVDYSSEMTTAKEGLASAVESLSTLYTDLYTLKQELDTDLDFCNDRADTWLNASTFLYNKALEEQSSYY